MTPESQAARDVVAENAAAHAKYEAEVLERTGGDLNRNATIADQLAHNDDVAPRGRQTARSKTTAKSKAAAKRK